MALIECPECKKLVSNKTDKCIHCGASLVVIPKIVCTECKEQFNANEKACPNCGCPKNKMNKNTTLNIIIAIVIVASLLLVSLISVLIIKNIRENLYQSRLEKTLYMMIDDCAKAEDCANDVSGVWWNAIDNGEDFNIAINKLYEDEEFNAKIDEMEKNREKIVKNMKKLKNPPKKYDETYPLMEELYEIYKDYTNLVKCPSGSYNSFVDQCNENGEAVTKVYNKLELQLE